MSKEVPGIIFTSNPDKTWKHLDEKKEMSKFVFSQSQLKVINPKTNSVYLEADLTSKTNFIESTNTFHQFWSKGSVYGVYFAKEADAQQFKEAFQSAVELAKQAELGSQVPFMPPPCLDEPKELPKSSTDVPSASTGEYSSVANLFASSDTAPAATDSQTGAQESVLMLSKKLAVSFGGNVIASKPKDEKVPGDPKPASVTIPKVSSQSIAPLTVNRELPKIPGSEVKKPLIPKRFESISKTTGSTIQFEPNQTKESALKEIPNVAEMEKTLPAISSNDGGSIKSNCQNSQTEPNDKLDAIGKIAAIRNRFDQETNVKNGTKVETKENVAGNLNKNSYAPNSGSSQPHLATARHESISFPKNSGGMNSSKPDSLNNEKKHVQPEIHQNSALKGDESSKVLASSTLTRDDLDFLKAKILTNIHEEFDKLYLRLSSK